MAKDSYYFTHDYNARNDEKILEIRSEFGAEGYGIFWMIIETMAENNNGGVKASLIGGLSLGYGVAKILLSSIFSRCLEIGLFYEEDGNYFSKRLLSHKEYRAELSKNGRDGAAKRWGGYSHPNAKERKGKEIKGISFSDDKKFVIFPDGTKQDLGMSQIARVTHDDLMPNEILKGQIH